jgi:hypothetical protein
MNRNPLLDESCVHSILRSFQMHFRQMLLSAGISLAPLSQLISGCFFCFQRQFMQIKRTPNILFLKPT